MIPLNFCQVAHRAGRACRPPWSRGLLLVSTLIAMGAGACRQVNRVPKCRKLAGLIWVWSVFSSPLLSAASPDTQIRIGFVGQNTSLPFELFRQQLHALGYVEGSNVRIEHRDPKGDIGNIPKLVEELAQQKMNVIVAANNVAIEAARKLGLTTPVVMLTSIDPVLAGYVVALNRPGANVTGVASLMRDLSAKRMELLRDMFPRLSRVAVIWDELGPGPRVAFQNYELAAKASKIRIQSLPVRGPRPDLEGAFKSARQAGAEAVILVANPTISQYSAIATALSFQYRIPSMVESGSWVTDGALVSYGSSKEETAQRVAIFVDRILKGAKPADLPVEQITRFELIVNAKTAKALGIRIPQSVLVRADKVIE